MHLRSIRIILLFIFLICLVLWSGSFAVRAKAPIMQAGRSFQPSGHGMLVPKMVKTDSMPRISMAMAANTSLPHTEASPQTPGGGTHSSFTSQTVVNVPPPTSTDPTAKQGQHKQAGKPDANGTGGIDNYVEATNSAVTIYTRSGTLQLATTYRSWFNVASAFYQPMTMWDDVGGRFLFSVLQEGAQVVWLSVAQQADATGTYCNYSIPVTTNRDFDRLGVDADGIYFSVNVVSQQTGQVINNELVFANRTALESCQTASYTTWTGLTNPDGTIAQSITPAREDGSTPGVEYLVNSYPGGACKMTLWTLTSSSTLTNASVSTQCYTPPPNAKQKGSSALINTDDARIDQASLVNGMLTVTTPGSYNWGDGNGQVSIVQWYVINVGTAAISTQGAFGTPGYWLYYPEAITTANGHMLFVYNASGPNSYPSVWYVNQTLTGATALANGNSYYGNSGISPWGDYQSVWPDASGGTANAAWITGEYAKSSTIYGTVFDLVTP